MTGALAWQVKTTLNKIFYFLGFGGRRPSLFSILGFWAGLLPCVRVSLSLSLSLSLNLSQKSQKAQNLLVLPNAQKTSIHYPIQTGVARIAAPYAAHQKGSLTQKKSAVLTPNLLGRVMLAITAKEVYLLRQLELWCILVSSSVECLFVLVLGLKSLLM